MRSSQTRPEESEGAPFERGVVVSAVRKRYGPVQALDDVDLKVSAGEVVSLLGRNGAGKSTLIRILATSVLPDAGDVWIDGVDALAHPQVARRWTGLVLGEDRSFFWRLSGRRNLEFFAALHGLRRLDAEQASEAALEAVGLAEVADRRVDRYSSGMRSRLGIARALLGSPSVLLLDEPSRSLDPAAAWDMRQLVRSLAADKGVAVILATHDLHEASALATDVAIMERGKIVVRFGAGVEAATLEAAIVGLAP